VVRIRLLGGVGAVTDHGEPVDVGPAKCRALLAALALSPGTAVPVWRLVELVWGENPPRTAGRTLQSYVTRLRKGLGHDSITRVGAAYRLDVAAESVDVVRFQRGVEAGDFHAALAEWVGLPLAGHDVPGLTATVDGLVEQWLSSVEADLARRVETDPAAAVGPLTELTAGHPFREGLWALLMTALYRTGRQTDALAAYRAVRRNLVEHLGVEPGPRLRDLENLVLGQDERLAGRRGRPTGTVTFAFADVADPGRRCATDRQAMAATTADLDRLVDAAADRHGGDVFATGGDSFGVAFHRATDAVAWATELRGGVAVPLRIGLHTAEVEERAPGYAGPAVTVAAALAAAGHGGQTLVSGTTSALLDRDDLRDLGVYRLDGTEQRVHQLGDGEHPPLHTEASRRHGNLPRRLGLLIGRDDELKVIDDALATHPVVTLVGPGGIGKTRLAVAAASRVAVDDGVWLVDLTEIASAADVPRAVAGPLGIRESAGRPLDESVVMVLRSRHALLVLDNCEHVLDGAATLVEAVVAHCPNVRVLATSRERLDLGDGHERIVAVPPLDPAGSGAELFTARAAAVSPAFDPDSDRRDVEEICRRLDGIPLAIELAAARTTSLATADLLTRLDDHLRVLVGGRRTGAERHRGLRATVQWSYDLLSPPGQLLFRRLSVFTGPFDLAAAEAIAEAEVDELLGDLVRRSVVVVESGPFGQRFRLLETMRQFAAELLAETGGTTTVAARHARWCLDEVTRIHRLLTGPAEAEGVARLDELWPNLRSAFDRACAGRDRGLAYALIRPVVAEIPFRSRSEIGDWTERLLAITPPGEPVVLELTWAAQRYKLRQDPAAFARLLDRYGEPDHPLIHHARASVHEDYPALVEWTPPALGELRRRGEHDLARQLELDIGSAYLFTGRFAEHDSIVTALADRYRTQGPPTLLNWALMLLGYSAAAQGRQDHAEQLFDDAVGLTLPEHTHSPNKPIQARTWFRRGDRSRGLRTLRSYVEDLLDTDNMHGACVAAVEYVPMMAEIGRLPQAAQLLRYLETTGMLDTPVWATRVAGARSVIADLDRAPARPLDDRQALGYMRQSLHELTL
jgi:predicted ATPase/DNA-binding SARP family transcriptional activator